MENDLQGSPGTATRRRENTPRQAAFWKVSGSFLSKLLGFARDVLIAKIFGATFVVDVAQLVESVLLNIVSFITSPISIPLVPELTHARMQSERDYRSLLSSVFGLFSIVGLVMFTGVSVFPHMFVTLFSGGFKGAVLAYAEYTYRWMAALSIIIVISATIKTALTVKKDFMLLSFSDVLMNVVVIGGLLLGARQTALPILKTSAQLVPAAALWIYFAIREKWYLLPRYGHWDPRVKSLLKQAGPLFIGSATDMLLTLIDRTMASFLPEGSIASLGYAQKIFLLPLGVWAVQIAESSYPYIVLAFATDDVTKGYLLARGAIRRILFFIVPAMTGLLLLAPGIVRVIYQRGAFTASNTVLVAHVLQGYMGMLLFSSVQYIETRLFYARRNTMTQRHLPWSERRPQLPARVRPPSGGVWPGRRFVRRCLDQHDVDVLCLPAHVWNGRLRADSPRRSEDRRKRRHHGVARRRRSGSRSHHPADRSGLCHVHGCHAAAAGGRGDQLPEGRSQVAGPFGEEGLTQSPRSSEPATSSTLRTSSRVP
jgi:putative peptidoglycan lipid II flippase